MPTRSDRRPAALRATRAPLAVACALLLVVPAGAPAQGAGFHVEGLRAEYHRDPVGLGERAPRLSWKLHADRRGTRQGAYQIRVAADSVALSRAPLWDTGRVPSDSSIHRAYAGPALESGRRYYWQVRAWDDAGRASAWSAPASWEMGLLEPADWRARWITPDLPEDTAKSNPSPMLRAEFTVDGRVARARAYVTSLGLYEMELNGRRVGDQVLTPGWTSYDTRLQYQSYDVTDLLRPGANAVGVMLGDGWYRGRLAWETQRNVYGKRLALLTQIVIRYADGREQVVASGDDWKASTGPVVMSDIYDGERYDARLEKAGWSRAGYDASGWRPVRTIDHSKSILIAPAAPPVRRVQELKPVKVLRTPAGETVFDMGQNMVGWVRLRARGPAGTAITLRHAEVLDKAGNFYTENLRGAKQTVTYTLRGGGEEVYEPRFTFQGFRYVAVDGYPGEPTADALTGVVVHSDMAPTGTFETSNPLVNQLQRNIVWGQRGNFVDVPTDCPQRDERLGWTGDAQAFARTAAFNMDVAGFFTKWLADLAADQKANGAVPDVVPDVISRNKPTGGGSAGWADAAVIVPWTMYLTYGDTRVLERQFPSMRKWVEYQREKAGPSLLWRTGWHYGDWLAFATTRSDYPGATTDKDLIATAFFAHSSDLLARSAEVLGKGDEARRYRALSDSVRAAFTKEFVTATGRLTSNTQTAYALALEFDLLPPALRGEAARRLADDVRGFGHLTTGFLGTPHLTHALSRTGGLDLAYALLTREKYPSWLYPVTQGATTIWERWDGQKPDGTFQDKGMNSFNHYAYGAVGAWMYGAVAGLELDPREPGYRHSLIQPQPGGGLTRASASLETMYGKLASAWTHEAGRFRLDASVPPNTRSTVRLPGARLEQVTEGGRPLRGAAGVREARQDGADVVVEVGSGAYRFAYPLAMPAAAAAPASR
jgi:alpha-L-rhamnosidase